MPSRHRCDFSVYVPQAGQSQGRGIEEKLLFDALKRAYVAAQQVGSALIIVHALDENAERFYKKYGFIAFDDVAQGLYLPTATVAQLIR